MSVNFSNYFIRCTDSRDELFIFTAFIITKTFLFLPLSVLIFHVGHQRWRKQRSFTTTSHSDIFTYHMITHELVNVLGGSVYICASYAGAATVASDGLNATNFALPGQLFCHILTCVDRYLAVVHPVTYLWLKQSNGVKIRNIGIACDWLLCIVWGGTLNIGYALYIQFFSLMALALVVVSFCSFRILCVLARRGPGEGFGDGQRVDQSKQRAFHTVTAIMGMLWLWFTGFIVCVALSLSELLSYSDTCVVLISSAWFSLPSSLVLPLLFLHRAGKLACCH